MKETLIKIIKNDKITLSGIVHIPDEEMIKSGKKVGVHIIVPGIKYRVAPNRLSVKIARYLCEKGFYVLRTDPEGVGESDGDLGDKKVVKDIFSDIQKGLFVEDTIAAVDYFRQEFKLDDIVLLGNCGGAVTALLSHAKCEVENLILIDLPIVYSSDTIGYREQALRGGGYSEKILSNYISKIWNYKKVMRFLTFKSEYGVIYNLIKMKLKPLFNQYPKSKSKLKIGSLPEITESGEKLNINLFKSFEAFKQKRGKALLLCAEFDAGTPLLEDYFFNYFSINESENESKSQKHVIKSGNHIYTEIGPQKELIECISRWLKINYRLNESS